jgi:hypothetical protein
VLDVEDTRELSRAMKLLLLQRAVLSVHERYGVPLTDEAEAFFQAEVSILYRACLIARRSCSPRTFESAARAQVVAQLGARFGAAQTERLLQQSEEARQWFVKGT